MLQLVFLQTQAQATGGHGTSIITLLVFVGFIFLNGKTAKWKGYPFWVGAISGITLFLGTILFLIMPFNQKKNKEDK